MSTQEEIVTMLDDVEKREEKLSDWERQFIDDLSVKLGRGQSITPAQDAKLTQIWNRVT